VFTCASVAIAEARVMATMVGGRLVHDELAG